MFNVGDRVTSIRSSRTGSVVDPKRYLTRAIAGQVFVLFDNSHFPVWVPEGGLQVLNRC